MKRKKRKPPAFFTAPLSFALFCFIIIYALLTADRAAFPQAMEIAGIDYRNRLNDIIVESAAEVSREMELYSYSLYTTRNGDISINTGVVNEFCSRLSGKLKARVPAKEREEARVPLGSVTGVKYLAGMGPDYSVSILPMGTSSVDYNSSLAQAGINLVNFRLWIDVSSTIRIVNPLRSGEITIAKKVTLVDVVIRGEVPAVYVN
ncbi:MAG: sporulation protein YunB [Clostridiales bacterium]|nr:sporulation protein YunB [Clostridiales bacterium]